MIKTQKKIEFINSCNCIVDYEMLKKAMLWYSSKPLYSQRAIFMHGNYPAVSIYDEKIHIHRLLMMYKLQSDIDTNYYVHHIDGNHNDKLCRDVTDCIIKQVIEKCKEHPFKDCACGDEILQLFDIKEINK